jgi:hypothetical protein
MELKIHFYLADIDGKFIDDLISAWTWLWNIGTPPISHVELEFVQHNICFSSTSRRRQKGAKHKYGTRFALSSDILKHKNRWISLSIACSAEEYNAALVYAISGIAAKL